MRELKADAIDQENKIKEEQGGPWGGKAAPDEEEDEDEEKESVPVVQQKIEEEPKVEAKARYVPPSMRNQPAGGLEAVKMTPGFRSRPGRAPALDNNEEFPTLGAGPPPELGKDFQAVRHGTRDLGNSRSAGGPSVTIGNKFNALNTSANN